MSCEQQCKNHAFALGHKRRRTCGEVVSAGGYVVSCDGAEQRLHRGGNFAIAT
jgi:hypothetical protein